MIAPAAVSWLSRNLGLTRSRGGCGMLPRMKLLVVEDDAALQATLVRTLLRRGFGVTAVGDGAAAGVAACARTADGAAAASANATAIEASP